MFTDSSENWLDDDKVVILIDLVRKHPFLYDKKCRSYRQPILKDKAWSSIASILDVGITGDKVKHRWKNLRDRFMKELKKVEDSSASGAGSTDVHCPKWIYFEELVFLREHCERRRTSSNYQATTLSPDSEEESDVQIQQMETEYLDEALEIPDQNKERSSRKKRKSDTIDSQIENLVNQVGDVIAAIGTKKNPFEPFCSSLAEKLERLPAHVARALETKYTAEVNNLLDQYESE